MNRASGKNNEIFYVVSVFEDVSKDNFFEVRITYDGGTKKVYHVPSEQVSEFQEGRAFYLDHENFN